MHLYLLHFWGLHCVNSDNQMLVQAPPGNRQVEHARGSFLLRSQACPCCPLQSAILGKSKDTWRGFQPAAIVSDHQQQQLLYASPGDTTCTLHSLSWTVMQTRKPIVPAFNIGQGSGNGSIIHHASAAGMNVTVDSDDGQASDLSESLIGCW